LLFDFAQRLPFKIRRKKDISTEIWLSENFIEIEKSVISNVLQKHNVMFPRNSIDGPTHPTGTI